MQTPISYKFLFLCLVFAIGAYVYGIDSRFAPKNGDEYPYTHIVRMTNTSGQWLPLQSEMEGVKNTKPPLLFWQAMASTEQGKEWSLFDLNGTRMQRGKIEVLTPLIKIPCPMMRTGYYILLISGKKGHTVKKINWVE